MPFLIQRASGRNLTLTQVHGEILRVGRGTNQELRSDNPAVALEHAVIETDSAGYSITDKGSITGTYVNRKPVEMARLAKGDVIEIGDLRLEVQIADPTKPLFLRVVTARAAAAAFEDEEEQAAAAPGARIVKAKKFDYVGAYRLSRPWLTKLSVTAILLIIAFAVIGELVRPEKQAAFMPGGLSSAHARARDARSGNAIANDCDACHTPWKSVSGKNCMTCHAQQPHAMHASDEPDCFACHAEHRGATKLAALTDGTCTGCHARLAEHVRLPRAQLASLRFAEGRYSFNDIASVRAFGDGHPELSYANDPNTLRFNHALHLAPNGVFNATGKRQVLQCTHCHALRTVKGKSDPEPIDFERHCQSCHQLTFDARFPTSQVPHGGEPDIVYGYIGGMYSGDRDLVGRSPVEVRRILSTRRRTDVGAQGIFNADQVIKTKCAKCHDVVRNGPRLAVTPPQIRGQWLDRARFTHGRHANLSCETCHRGARASSATADVLMPRRENCTDCHASGKSVTAASNCVACHEYHLRPPRPVGAAVTLAQAGMGGPGSGGRMIQEILLAAIVVLLLVVLVPVGVALFQRLMPERATAPPIPRTAKPAPPPALAPTAKILRSDIPAGPVEKQPAAAPPDLAPEKASTRVLVIDEPAKPDGSTGTEMLQWNGLLHCTAGALEGQRFVIEDDGFYIGRDPVLSKVVIPDSRISKRHVRIVPRDGRVWAIDEGSTNGTFLKGQRITEVQLKRGDELVLSDAATFVYQI